MTASPKTKGDCSPSSLDDVGTERRLPLPPPDLAVRVGADSTDTYGSYLEIGQNVKAEILDVLPERWSFEGKRVLDFGCGAGRVLRQFAAEAEVAEMFGCDIDGPSVEWLNAHLSPPFSAVQNGEAPPLPWPDQSFDLILAASVFTHITAYWSEWLCELHRLLAGRGLVIATFLGPGMSETIAREPWDEDRIGMNVLRPGLTWDQGGPCVLHSPWWIGEHWGRAFDIELLRPAGFGNVDRESGHGYVLLRKKDVEITPGELARIRADEPRELQALRHNLQQLLRESAELERQNDQARTELAQYESSLSWRVTRPLRRASRLLRRGTSPH
jgi:SAM-dependent methyltransferase